ncbi:hypothetical protein OSCI_2530018 [Kamptonema sp. PCC 6506]|nr:hypothetical protein OSCI_2530018 [Kamptonema sp. PCC 6506]
MCLVISAILTDGFTLGASANSVTALNRIQPTIQPTNIATTTPDLPKAVLTLQDLPSGFKDMSGEAESLKKQLNNGNEVKAENVFAFQKSDDQQFQLIVGFTMPMLSRIEQASFDSSIRQQDFAQEFLKGLNEGSQGDFSNITSSPMGENIGDASAKWVTKGQLNGIPMRLEMAVFRRGNLGAMLMILYLDGESPSIAIADAARRLDSRIVELSPVSPTQPQ